MRARLRQGGHKRSTAGSRVRHYNYFRSYSAERGRYTQADPIGLEGGFNRFGYVDGNPLSEIDPEGLQRRQDPKIIRPLEEGGSGGVGPGSSGGGGRSGGGSISPGRGAGQASPPCPPIVSSRLNESPRLIKEAEFAGKSHQEGIDRLLEQLRKGNLNPGIGTKPVGHGFSEARARDGARVYFRETDVGIEILGKSNKENQDVVIKEIMNVFGK